MINSLLFINIIILYLLVVSPMCAQIETDRIVGKTGSRSITENEYIERYEFTPGFRRENKNLSESLKLEFLYTLLAEKLWSLEAVSLGMDTLEVMKFSSKAFEKMFVRDELYQREILNKIEISEDEIVDGYYRNNTKLYVNYLISDDEDEIRQLYQLLKQGIPFDSILAESPELQEQIEPVTIIYGQMDKSIEDSLYDLKIGEYTSPILTPDGWYIFILRNRSEQTLAATVDLTDFRKSVEKIIKARKEKDVYWQFKNNFLSDKKVDVEPKLFESLVQRLAQILDEKKYTDKIKTGDPVNFLADEVLLVENEFGTDSLKMNFILFEENPVSLKEYIRSLAFDGFNTTNCSLNYMRALLDSKTREFIEQELIYREGLTLGLNLLPEVQQQVRVWQDNYLFQILQEKFLDSASVTEQEVFVYYSSVQQEESYPVLIRITELYADRLEVMNQILDRINSGENFSEIVNQISPEENFSIETVESKLLPVSSFGEIGDIALSMNVDEVYGPMDVDGKFLIFKLMEKVDSHTIPPEPFEKVKENYRRELLKRKVKVRMNNFTSNLAVKCGLSIDFDVLDSIEVTDFSSFGIRHLGFGGKMTAVPLVAPNFNWINQYLELIKTIQQ